MSPADAVYAAELVARRLGLPVRATLVSPEHLVLAPSEVHENDGFTVEVHTGWRTAEVVFVPGKFARPMIARMGNAGPEARAAFAALAVTAARHGKLTFRPNGMDADPRNPGSWPSHWQRLDMALKRQAVVFEELAPSQMKQLMGEMIAPIFGMSIVLVGIDEVDGDDSALEGDSVDQMSRRYERKPVNREICLSTRGRRCFCCNFDFGETYGLEAEGFIEVHHVTPASEIGPSYRINPVTDLVPICSNCHSVIHLKKPPRSPDELRAMFMARRSAS